MHSPFINGALGRGFDYLITDDPHRMAENMETTINYVRKGLCTRLNTPATAEFWCLCRGWPRMICPVCDWKGSTNCRSNSM